MEPCKFFYEGNQILKPYQQDKTTSKILKLQHLTHARCMASKKLSYISVTTTFGLPLDKW